MTKLRRATGGTTPKARSAVPTARSIHSYIGHQSLSMYGVQSCVCARALSLVTGPGVFNQAPTDVPYARLSQTEMCAVLSTSKDWRCQPPQRSRKLIPANRAIRSSSAGHT